MGSTRRNGKGPPHAEVLRKMHLFIEKERIGEHEACRTEETPKHSESENATQEQSSADENTAIVSPDQGTSSGTATFKPLAKPAEKLDAEEFKQFLKQNTELLKLFSDLWGQGYDEVAWVMEQWIRFYEINALVTHTMEGPGREKNKFYMYMESPRWLDCTSSTMAAASASLLLESDSN